MAKFPFIGPSYTSQSPNVDVQRSVNFYPEVVESQRGKDVIALYPTPGLLGFVTLNGTSVRALKTINDRLFAVSGTEFVELFSNGTFTVRGTVTFGATPASIAASQNQLVIVSGGSAYSFDLGTNTFAVIAGLLGVPKQAEFMDGYFIILLANSKQFQISALLDATSWNALDTAIVSVFADNVTSMIVSHRELWLLGRKASQVYFNSGNPDFPFDVIGPGFIETGAIADWATVRLGELILWLAGDERGSAVAYRSAGYKPERISNHAVEFAWQGYSRVDDAIGYPYQNQGHLFWVIRFPEADATWVFDAATGEWHERGFWLTLQNRYEAHHSQCHAFAFGKHLVGDWKSGKVYEMSIDVHDDDGTAIRRLRRAPHISSEQRWIYHHRLQIDFEAGLGLVTGQGDNPQAIMRFSDDGGKTWSNDYFVETGKLGEYKRRAIWRRLGRSRDRVYEVSVSDPIPWRVAAAYLEASAGNGT